MGKSGAVNISSGLFLDQCFQSPSEGPISCFIQTQNSAPCCRWRENDVGLFPWCFSCRDQWRLWLLEQLVSPVGKPFTASYQEPVALYVHQQNVENCNRLKLKINIVILMYTANFLCSHVWKTRPPVIFLFFLIIPTRITNIAGDLLPAGKAT